MKKVIGVDLGGTSIYGGIINEGGHILKRTERPTPRGEGKRGVLDKIIEVIQELVDEDIIGIGIGTPGTIDSVNGKVLDIGGNIEDWPNTDIRREVAKVFPKLAIYVENDANVAALCEKWIGAGKDFSDLIMITLGTGVGGAVYLEKEGIVKGHSFQGGELGHAILYPKGRQCNCGQRGCADKYLAGSSIERTYFEESGRKKAGREIFSTYREDSAAKKAVEKYCEDLAIFIISLKNIFDSQGLIIGGGVINSKDIWWDLMLKYYREHSNPSDSMKIVPAIYLNDAGMIGAGRLVFTNEEARKER